MEVKSVILNKVVPSSLKIVLGYRRGINWSTEGEIIAGEDENSHWTCFSFIGTRLAPIYFPSSIIEISWESQSRVNMKERVRGEVYLSLHELPLHSVWLLSQNLSPDSEDLR